MPADVVALAHRLKDEWGIQAKSKTSLQFDTLATIAVTAYFLTPSPPSSGASSVASSRLACLALLLLHASVTSLFRLGLLERSLRLCASDLGCRGRAQWSARRSRRHSGGALSSAILPGGWAPCQRDAGPPALSSANSPTRGKFIFFTLGAPA